MLQLILHLIGDYVTQSDWMAQNKTKATFPAFCHALVYSLPFLLIGSPIAVLVIFMTHLLIDRFRLARYVAWLKNRLAPIRTVRMETKTITHPNGATTAEWTFPREKLWWHPWSECSETGYHKDSPAWLSVWLMIACDNTLHLLINYLSLANL